MSVTTSSTSSITAVEHLPSNQTILDPDLMSKQPTINIGMIGHVAHGKSTLTRGLSGVTTAKYKNEIKQNMTIKLGYANFKIFRCECPRPLCFHSFSSEKMAPSACAKCASKLTLVRHFSLVDSPGHHDLMATMLSGASIMDCSVLVVAANEACPCPQTVEHLVVASLLGLTDRMIVVQNKVDLCTPQRVAINYDEIVNLFRECVGYNTRMPPIIPVAAEMGLNLDVLCDKLTQLPVPKRDLKSPVLMHVVRTFDVNRPGTSFSQLKGGVVGGTVVKGTLRTNQTVELRPGVVRTDGTYQPIVAKVLSIQSEKHSLATAISGGLLGVSLDIDPALCKADRLVGQVLGAVGSLPPVFKQAKVSYRRYALKTGSKVSRVKKGERLLVCVGSARMKAFVTAVDSDTKLPTLTLELGAPICADLFAKVALFRRKERNDSWKLIGFGSVDAILPAQQSVVQSQVVMSSLAETLDVIKESNESKAKNSIQDGDDDSDDDYSDDDSDDDVSSDEDESKESILEKNKQYSQFKPNAHPVPGEIVMVKVTRLQHEVGAWCELVEYSNTPGLILHKELSKGRIKSLRKVIRIDDIKPAMVLRVSSKGYVDLSRRRVEKKEARECEETFRDAKLVKSILQRVAMLCGVSLRSLYRKIIWPLEKRDRNPLDSFYLALHDPYVAFKHLYLRQCEEDEWTCKLTKDVEVTLLAELQRRLKQKPLQVKTVIGITCYAPHGLVHIKEALSHAFPSLVDEKNTCVQKKKNNVKKRKNQTNKKQNVSNTATVSSSTTTATATATATAAAAAPLTDSIKNVKKLKETKSETDRHRENMNRTIQDQKCEEKLKVEDEVRMKTDTDNCKMLRMTAQSSSSSSSSLSSSSTITTAHDEAKSSTTATSTTSEASVSVPSAAATTPDIRVSILFEGSPQFSIFGTSMDKKACFLALHTACEMLSREMSARGGEITIISAPTVCV